MLNLAYKINSQIKINGHTYKVNTSFDNVLRFYDMVEEKDLSETDKIEIGLRMFLDSPIELDLFEKREVLDEIIKVFLTSEKDKVKTDRKGNPLPVKKEESVYDLEHDAEFIFASFIQAYGIDLIEQQGRLPWLKFKALLNGLPEDTKFRQVIDIRTCELPKGKHASEERKRLKELKKLYSLPKDEDAR